MRKTCGRDQLIGGGTRFGDGVILFAASARDADGAAIILRHLMKADLKTWQGPSLRQSLGAG